MQTESEILADLLIAQGRCEGKIDSLIDYVKQSHKDNEDWKSGHDTRLSTVEKKANIASGVLAVIMFIITPILTVFGIYHRGA